MSSQRQYRDKFFGQDKAGDAKAFAEQKEKEGWRVSIKTQEGGATWVYFSKGFEPPPEADSMLGLLAAGEMMKARAMMIGFFGPSEERNKGLADAIGKWDEVAEPVTDKSER